MRTLAAAAVLLVVTGCPSPSPGQCTSSAQCPTAQSCVSGACVGGTSAGGAAGTGGGSAGTGGGASLTGGGSGSTAGGATGTGGESCVMAQAVVGTTTLSGTTVGASADVNLTCTGSRNQGPDRVYAVTVPNLQRLTVTLTPEETDTSDGGLQFDPSLYLVAGPAAACAPADAGDRTACLDGSDIDMPPGSPERVAWLNTTGAPREVFVVVDSFFTAPDETNGVTHQGRYDLSFTVAAPPMGDRCDTATTITPGALQGQSLTGYSGDYGFGTNCRRSDGPDRAYAVSVPAGQRLTAIAAPANDAGFDVTLNLVAGPAAACERSPLVCLGGSDALAIGGTERVDYLNRGTTAQDVFLVVGSYDPTDLVTDFSLTTSVAMPPAGDECASAVALTAGTPLTGQSFGGFGNDYGTGTGCGFTSSGPDRVYSLTIPPYKLATITATPSAGLNTSISLIDGTSNCVTTALRCVATSTSTLATDPDVVTWTNRSAAPQTLLVLVDSTAPGTGTFELSAIVSDPPAGDSCSNPTTLAAGGAFVASTTTGFTNDYTAGTTSSCATFDTTGSDRVFSFNVPAGQRAKVTVNGATDGGYVPSVSLVTGTASACEAAPRVCVASANSSSLGTMRTASFVNGAAQAQTGFAIVDGPLGAGVNFAIGLSTATPVADDVCSTATTMLGATMLTGQTLRPGGLTFDRDYTCVSASRGVDRVYVVQAQPNQRLTVTVTPTPVVMDGGFDPVLSLIGGPAAACDSASRRCLAARDVGGRLAPETAAFTNSSPTAQPVFVVVGSYNETDTDTSFSLQATSAAIPAGEVCENAQAITSGMSLPAETLTSFSRDFGLAGGGCSLSSGADRVYSVSVGANQTLTVRGVPDAMADIVLNVIEGPAANCNAGQVTCVASADRGSDGQEDRLTWTNPSAAAKTVFLVVSSYRAGPMTWSLEVTVQ